MSRAGSRRRLRVSFGFAAAIALTGCYAEAADEVPFAQFYGGEIRLPMREATFLRHLADRHIPYENCGTIDDGAVILPSETPAAGLPEIVQCWDIFGPNDDLDAPRQGYRAFVSGTGWVVAVENRYAYRSI